MITIYKYSRYTLPFKREIKINAGARLLKAGMDSNEILCVWVYSDSNAPKRDFKMVIVDMGEGGLKPTTPALNQQRPPMSTQLLLRLVIGVFLFMKEIKMGQIMFIDEDEYKELKRFAETWKVDKEQAFKDWQALLKSFPLKPIAKTKAGYCCDMCENEIYNEEKTFCCRVPLKVLGYKGLHMTNVVLCERCASAVADYIGPVY